MKMKKMTHKDRYGNQISYEFESDTKPLDPTKLMEKSMDAMGQMQEMSVPMMDHPGEPMGSDTVPAWLTPGEFVVNAEAMRDPQNAAMVESINDQGRAMQAMQGGSIPTMYQRGGKVAPRPQPAPFIAAPLLTGQSMYRDSGGGIPMPVSMTDALLHAREGFRDDVYLDSLGKPTVGAGHLLPQEWESRVGERPFTKEQLDAMFAEDRAKAEEAAKRNLGKETWDKLNKRQKATMTSMAFQLGETGQAGFPSMLKAIQAGDYEEAVRQAKTGSKGGKSLWYQQTPARVEDVEAAFLAEGGWSNFLNKYVLGPNAQIPQDVDTTADVMSVADDGWSPPAANVPAPAAPAAIPAESAYQQNLQQQIAQAENMVAGGDGDDLGNAAPPTFGGADITAAGQEPPAPPQAPPAMGMPDESSAEIPQDAGADVWSGLGDWAFGPEGTAAADSRNKAFNVKASEANLEAAQATLAELEERAAAGEPVNEKTLEGAAAAVVHQEAKVAEAEKEHFEQQGAYDDAIMRGARKAEIEEEAKARGVTPEVVQEEKQVAEMEAIVEDTELEDDGSAEGHTEDAAEQAANTPEGRESVEQAKSFMGEVFGDLFDAKELTRMAILYAGSRLLGGSHHGSLNWAAKGYLQRVDAKAAAPGEARKLLNKQAFELAKGDKYTSASIKAYQQSGDIGDLVSKAGDPASLKYLGNQQTYYTDSGQQIQAQEVQAADGSRLWVGPNGQALNLNKVHTDPSRVPGTREYTERVQGDSKLYTGMIEGMREQFGTLDKENNLYKTDLAPSIAGNKTAKWAIDNNIPPEYMGQIVEGAMHSAMADSAQSGRKVRDLTPYLNSQWVSAQVGDTTLFQNKSGDVVSGRKVQNLMTQAEGVMRAMNPEKFGNLSNAAVSTIFMQNARGEWNNLDPKIRSGFEKQAGSDESGFMLYVKSELQKTVR